jgi:hypothetical protein
MSCVQLYTVHVLVILALAAVIAATGGLAFVVGRVYGRRSNG